MKLIIVACAFLASIAISSSVNISMDVQLSCSYKATLYSDGNINAYQFLKKLDPISIPSPLTTSATVLLTKTPETILMPLTTATPENTTALELVHNLTSCAEIFRKGITKSGIYTIFPQTVYKITPFKVYCDMETSGGGWTVFQRRDDYEPRENFTRNWQDYKNGFGDLEREFWLGNDHIFVLTNQDDTDLRVDLEDFEKGKRWAEYSHFRIKNEENLYTVSFSKYTGDAGDSLTYHNEKQFSTYDRDNPNDCARDYKGGWWYNYCQLVNLNGVYLKGKANDANGVVWYGWRDHYYSLKKSEMKIRPTNF